MSMANDPGELEVKNNTEAERFELTLDGLTAFVQYRIIGKRIIFIHTEVPSEFSGKGIGNRLAQVALDYAQAHRYQIDAQCPFIAAYIRKHPEYQSITVGY